MTIQITIIGLGQIGTSIGLCLSGDKNFRRVGHDRELEFARTAEKMGALDKVDLNLPHSVRDADIVILSIPVDQIQETLEYITQDLRPGAVVLDTAPAKEFLTNWTNQHLPADRNYIGLFPVINSRYLLEHGSGVEAAHADLFRDSPIAIVAPHQTSAGAIKLAVDLTYRLGAKPLFTDPLEIDGLISAIHTLPQLMAVALVNATIDESGWNDGQKIAGRHYAQATEPISQISDPKSLKSSAMLNRKSVSRMIDSAISELQAMRQDLVNEDEASLEKRLQNAIRGREMWFMQRQGGNWRDASAPAPEIPTSMESIGQLFGLNKLLKGKKK